MALALPAIDNINVLIVPLKQQHWVGPDTHTHTRVQIQMGIPWNWETMLWLSLEIHLHFIGLREPHPSEKSDILNSWLKLPL